MPADCDCIAVEYLREVVGGVAGGLAYFVVAQESGELAQRTVFQINKAELIGVAIWSLVKFTV